MEKQIPLTLDADSFRDALAEVSTDMERTVNDELLPLAELLQETFEATARSIEEELERAARTGTFRFREMTQDILNDLATLAADRYIRQPLEELIGGLLGGGGAGGGSVPGVGISPVGKSTSVTLNLGQTVDVAGFRQSETQIAATLSRLLARAGRNS